MSIYNVMNFFIFFIQASEDDKGKTLVKYHAKNKEFFVLAYSKQRYRGNQAGNSDVNRIYFTVNWILCKTFSALLEERTEIKNRTQNIDYAILSITDGKLGMFYLKHFELKWDFNPQPLDNWFFILSFYKRQSLFEPYQVTPWGNSWCEIFRGKWKCFL